MLTITEAQIRAMRAATRAAFAGRAVAHLRRRFPARTAPVEDARLRAFVDLGIDRARRYGIVGEADVLRYLEYMLIYGARFDTDPRFAWAGEILRRAGLGPSRRMDLIDDYDMFRMNRS
ncbi:MAG TPA: hypothetical protein PK072_11915 [Quisquiliibacterium sp.]|nr:hypothetical protein [Quisquiliibacterium sp.]HPA88716.1 hypothetical protein [Quisquiliibacterium sp.]HQN12225.1 hypothetical protein [Quisquiliibacterium sp.]HQP67343.1 hypothetical protein [Quisquiliibacterium sp.]